MALVGLGVNYAKTRAPLRRVATEVPARGKAPISSVAVRSASKANNAIKNEAERVSSHLRRAAMAVRVKRRRKELIFACADLAIGETNAN